MSAAIIALYREEQISVPKESTPGTMVDATTADTVLPISGGMGDMPIELLEDAQYRNTRSKLPLIAGRTPPGSWKLETYLKPSGTAGTAPEGSTLYECAFGVKTVNASTSVVYSLADNLPSFTMWRKIGHTMFVNRGCTVGTAQFSIEADKPGQVAWSGNFIEQATIGTDAVGSGAIDSSATTLPVVNGAKYYVTASTYGYVQVGAEIMKVTGVSGNNLTVTRGAISTAAAAHLAGVAVVPYIPATTESGYIVHGKLGAVTLGGSPTFLITSKLTIDNGIKYYDNEKNGVLTAETYGTPGHRIITCSISRYFRSADAGAFNVAFSKTLQDFNLVLGTAAGKIATFDSPNAESMAPKFSGNEEVQQDIDLRLVATSGSLGGELTLTFT